jgi:hypothetical protein
MSSPLSRVTTRVAYGASQLPRIAWYVGHSLAVRRLGRVEMWRGGCRLNISVAAPFVWRCLSGSPWLRFHIPLIEPDRQISRIRLSDKNSRLCFRVRRHLQFLNTLRS